MISEGVRRTSLDFSFLRTDVTRRIENSDGFRQVNEKKKKKKLVESAHVLIAVLIRVRVFLFKFGEIGILFSYTTKERLKSIHAT
jgi:hypothetical protein